MGAFQLNRSFFSPYCGYGLIKRVSGVAIHTPNVTALRLGIDVVGIGWIKPHPETVAVVHVFPSRICHAARVG
jgi:hypothetical protein